MYLRFLCDLRLHHWHAIRSHRLHLNLVPTRLCVLSKCFWVSSRSHCSHLNSLEKACVAKVPNNELFQYINWKKTHQYKITFKHFPNLLATFRLYIKIDPFWSHCSHLYWIHLCWLWSHHVGILCLYESLFESLYHKGHIYIYSCMFISNVQFKCLLWIAVIITVITNT